MSHILKKIEKKILDFERDNSFDIKWYSIFVNPFFITRKALLANIKRVAGTIDPHARILDVGCGTKPYRKLFSSPHYTGIEIQGGGHDDVAKSYDAFFDGENIPFPDQSFDFVMATEVLEHVGNPEKLTKEMYRILRKGGKIFITVPFVWPEHEKPYDFRRLTSFGHEKILRESGFGEIKTEKTTGIFSTCGQLISDFIIDFVQNGINAKMDSRGIKYKFKFITVRLSILFICMPIQIFFITLNWIFGKKGLPLDFISIAHKK